MPSGADITRFLAGVQAARERALKAALRAVDRFGVIVLGDAQQLTPVDTGALKASATELPAEEAEGSVTKVIGFNTNYAAAVHERLNARHDQGQAKYLETPMREKAPAFGPFVAAEVKKSLGG